MRPILRAPKMGHAINAGEGGTTTAIAMGIEFLLGEDIATVLQPSRSCQFRDSRSRRGAWLEWGWGRGKGCVGSG